MTKKIVLSLLIVTVLTRIPSKVSGLEYIVTNTVGGYNTPLNTTTNKLDLGDNPVAKTIYVYIKYSQAEANLVNDTGGTGSFAAGLYGGSFKLTFATTTVAGVNSSSDITRGSSNTLNWASFTPNISPATTTPQSIFNQGAVAPLLTMADPGVGNFGYYIIGQVLISPGSTINPTGTVVTVGKVSGANWAYFDTNNNLATLTLTPSTFQFTVVPEPSTIAMGLISGISLVATGFYRRRQLKMSKSIV